jgi:hypothetical protein
MAVGASPVEDATGRAAATVLNARSADFRSICLEADALTVRQSIRNAKTLTSVM